jgi:hypothetical protein
VINNKSVCHKHGLVKRTFILKSGPNRGCSRVRCVECKRESQRRYSATDKPANRNQYAQRGKWNHIFRKYGITKQQWLVMLVKQQNRCVICCTVFSDDKKIHTDHCHATGRVRGLLCANCNSNVVTGVESAIRGGYLEKAVNYVLENATCQARRTKRK